MIRLARPLMGNACRRVKNFVHPTWYSTQEAGALPPENQQAQSAAIPRRSKFERRVWQTKCDVERILSKPNLLHVDAVSTEDVGAWYRLLWVDEFRAATELIQDVDNVPTWVLLYILTTKIHSAQDAQLALALTLQRLPTINEADQPALLIQTASVLAKYQLILSVPHIVDKFLQIPLQHAELQFDLLLRALSRFKQSTKMSKLIIRILESMRSRGLHIREHAYNALLANRFVTMELTAILQQRMREEGHVPTSEQLEAYLRIFGSRGVVHASAKYLNYIRYLRCTEGGVIPQGIRLRNVRMGQYIINDGTATRYNTEFMRTLAYYPGSAFHYLRSLLRTDHEDKNAEVWSLSGSRSQYAPRVGNWKTQVNEYDWTTALYAATLDSKMSAQQLLAMFEKCRSAYFKPTIATYTTIIRGLLRKGDSYVNVLRVWKEMRNSVTRLDKMAMTVGMDVLVGSGHALEAFQYIEELTSPNARVARLPIHRTRYFKAGSKPQVDTRLVDTILINSFMSALVEHGRPDVVLMLWDGMKSAFGLQPDAETMSIMMKAARRAHKIDISIKAILMELRTMMPGHEKWWMHGVEETSRDELVAKIQKALATELTTDSEREERDDQKVFTWRTRVSCVWNGTAAGTRAITIFRDLIYTNWPHLRHIQPPAKPNWSDEAQSASAVGNIARSIISSSRETESRGQDDLVPSTSPSPTATPKDPPPDVPVDRLLTSASLRPLGPYASLIPNEKTFAAYIALLGSRNRSSDIPLALAWMRELDIKPTKVTLARALALWSEVSLRGPLVEQFAPEDTREYEKLVKWLKEWLGEKGMVHESRVLFMFRQLRKERDPE